MADKKESKDKVKYQFGQSELDLDTYIHNLGLNVQDYVNRQNWNDGQRQEFMNAYTNYMGGLQDQLKNNTNRFKTDDFGVIEDTMGEFSDSDNDNIDPVGSEYYYNDKGERITTDDYNQLKDKHKKNYKTFSANREVASYFNKIGKGIVKKFGTTQEESKVDKFDLAKHGFVADWMKRNSPSGNRPDLKPYLDMDQVVNGKRGRKNRLNYLADELQGYINSLDGEYDFEGGSYKDMEDYKAKLGALLNHMRDGYWTNEDMILANQAGIGGDFYNMFFTEEEDPNLTDEQREAAAKQAEEEAAKKRQEENDKKWRADVDRRWNIYQNSTLYHRPDNGYAIRFGDEYLNDQGQFDLNKWRDSFTETDPYFNLIKTGKGHDLMTYLNTALKNPYTQEFSRALQYMINKGGATQLEDGRYYIAQQSDDKTQSALVYDPNQGILYRDFLGNIKPAWTSIKNKFYQNLDPQTVAAQYYKEGGKIEEFQLGGSMAASIGHDYESGIKQGLKDRAAAAGKDEKVQKADERVIGSTFNRAEATAANPNVDFTDVELARIGGAAADIVAAVAAFAPGAGTAVAAGAGVTSTLANLYADFNDDGVTAWEATKNLGMNLGMDLLGLIPGGGAASKFAKITKSIGGLIPKIALAYGAMATVNNGGEIKKSLDKAMDNPTKLNVQDWQNIAQAISVISGGSTMAGTAYKKKMGTASKNIQTPDSKKSIALDVKDASGKKQTILFTGKDADTIRTARDSNDVDVVNNILKKYEGTKDFTVSTDKQTEASKWYKPWDRQDTGKGRMNIFDIRQDKNGVYVDRTKSTWRGDKNWATPDTYIKGKNLDVYGKDFQTTAAYDAKVQQRKNDIIDKMRQGSDQEVSRQTKTNDLITRQQAKLDQDITTRNAINKTDLQSKLDTIRQNRAKRDWSRTYYHKQNIEVTQLDPAKTQLKKLQDQLASGLTSRGKPLTDSGKKSLQNRIKAQQKKVDSLQKGVDKYNKWLDANSDATIQSHKDDIDTWDKLDRSISSRQTRLDALRNYQSRWNPADPNHPFISKKYTDFINANKDADGNINLGDVRSTKMTIDEFDAMLKQAGIKFKQGGNININKVRKFKNSGSITNTKSTATWYDDMYNQNPMKNFLTGINDEYIDTFNQGQLQWYKNKVDSGYQPGMSTVGPKSEDIAQYQRYFNKTGNNASIEQAFSSGKITRPGNSGDNSSNGYEDGYFGDQEYLRHFGNAESWKGHDNELNALKEQFKAKGLDYYQDKDTGMYLLRKIQDQSQNPITGNSVFTKPNDKQKGQENSNNNVSSFKSSGNWLNSINPTLKYGLSRALYGDNINRRLTQMSIDGETPYYQNPFTWNVSQYSGLDLENTGLKTMGAYTSFADRAMTSDAASQQALQLDALNKGVAYRDQKFAESNEIARQTKELANQQAKQNALNEHQVAEQNKLTGLQSLANITKYQQAYLAKKHNIWDTFGQQLEYEERQKLLENKSKQDALVQRDIDNFVTENLKDISSRQGANLSDEAIDIYQQVSMGLISPSKLSDEQFNMYRQALLVAENETTELTRQYLNIPNSKWSTIRKYRPTNSQTEEFNIQRKKSGGKIAVAGIHARTKDAERFQKGVLESIKRNEKVLDRLSKSLYGYIKASIVK